MMLKDSTAFETLTKENQNLAQKLLTWLKKLIDDIKKAFAGVEANSAEAKAMLNVMDELQKKWDAALVGAVQNTKEAETAEESKNANSTQYSTRVTPKQDAENEDIRYSSRYNNVTLTGEDICRNVKELAGMDSVYAVDSIKLEKSGAAPDTIFRNYFNVWGNKLHSEVLGDISAKESNIRSEIRHGLTKEKIASIEAILTVIEKGKTIYAEQKKVGGAARIIVAAPIKIGATPYYIGVMLQRDEANQRLYLHDLILEKEGALSAKADLHPTGANEDNEHLFLTSILANALAVKYQTDAQNQLRETGLSARELLSTALVDVAQTDAERDRLKSYQRAVKQLDETQARLEDVRSQIHDIMFTKGADRSNFKALEAQKTQLEKKLDWWDKRLMGLQNTKALKAVLERERTRVNALLQKLFTKMLAIF